MIFCVDSNIIIWGIKKQATQGQEEMISRAESFFAKADEYNDEIIIPSIVLAEILAPETPNVRARYLEVLTQSFIIADFDTRAALKYAELLHGRFPEIRRISDEAGIPRQKMKADHMIVAVAIVNGANAIYSTDPGLRTFASGYIDVRDLPLVRETQSVGMATQQKLWQETKSESSEKKEDDNDTPL